MSRPDPLPANIDAEKAILGAILLDNAAQAEAIRSGLKGSDFYLQAHVNIWQRMAGLMKDQCTVDIVTLAAELTRHKEIEFIGGVAYLASLTEGLPRRTVIVDYVRILKDRKRERDLLKLAELVMARVYNQGEPVAEISSWAAEQFAALTAKAMTGNCTGRWAGEGMETFLADAEDEIGFLIPDVLAPGCLTQIYAPRGLGKSLLADFWAVILAASGKRVLILDRDNPRRTLQLRLRGFGASDFGDQKINLRVISREQCPPLTKAEEWAEFPYADYDLVVVDSLDAMAEGVGEQDSSKPARAMAPLLDICHRENGPAVLLLGNTIKTAAHSRGSGVIEDRADIVYEVRDATDFRPTGQKPWIEELPPQGASEWAARSSRRKGRTTYRLALVTTKFRLGEEPAPRMLEISTADIPWSVADVTAEIDALGEAERLRVVEEKRAKLQAGVEKLQAEIVRRTAAGMHPMLKTDAEMFLMAEGCTRKNARSIMESDYFEAVPGQGKGHPLELHRRVKDASAEMRESLNPSKDKDSAQPHFRRPHLEHTAEIDPSQTRINTGDLRPPISATDTSLTDEMPPADEPGKASGEALLFDLEV